MRAEINTIMLCNKSISTHNTKQQKIDPILNSKRLNIILELIYMFMSLGSLSHTLIFDSIKDLKNDHFKRIHAILNKAKEGIYSYHIYAIHTLYAHYYSYTIYALLVSTMYM